MASNEAEFVVFAVKRLFRCIKEVHVKFLGFLLPNISLRFCAPASIEQHDDAEARKP
jgi:hypothetical protein